MNGLTKEFQFIIKKNKNLNHMHQKLLAIKLDPKIKKNGLTKEMHFMI